MDAAQARTGTGLPALAIARGTATSCRCSAPTIRLCSCRPSLALPSGTYASTSSDTGTGGHAVQVPLPEEPPPPLLLASGCTCRAGAVLPTAAAAAELSSKGTTCTTGCCLLLLPSTSGATSVASEVPPLPDVSSTPGPPLQDV